MKRLIQSLLTICLCTSTAIAMAVTLPEHSPVPGGIAVIDLESSAEHAPVVHCNNKPVMVLRHDNRWHAIVGLGLSTKAGEKELSSRVGSQTQTHRFTVRDKEYESQYITIKDKRKVNPLKRDMERIGKERKQITTALAHWSEQRLDETLQLDIPVEGRLSSPFGLRRFFNQQPRKPHSGIDIAAATGTPISAPASGKIILTGDFFFNGNSVFIDHGQGLVTMYCHMDRIDVEEDQLVERGEQIGTIGMTGRVTGPHLHWSVSLNDARIDPNLIVPALATQAELIKLQ